MKLKKLKYGLMSLLVGAIVMGTVYNLDSWQLHLLSGDLDINTIDFTDIQSAEFANPSGALIINKPGVYPINSVYLDFTDIASEDGFISGIPLQNSPLQLVATGITAGQASINNKNIVINTMPFDEFTVDIYYGGVIKSTVALTVSPATVCTDAFITAIEPNGGTLDLNNPADLGAPSHAQIESADLVVGNTFRFLADDPNTLTSPPAGAANFVTEVRLVNTPTVLTQKARIIEQNQEDVILEVGAVDNDLSTTLSNLTYAFNDLAEDYVYIDAVVNGSGLYLTSEEYGDHTDEYTCFLNDEIYLDSSACFNDQGQDGLYGFNPVRTVDGPLDLNETYPLVVSPQGGNYSWKVTKPSVATVTPLSKLEDMNVSSTVDFISAPLTSAVDIDTNDIEVDYNNGDCEYDENNVVLECNITVTLPFKYPDDGTHEALVTADGVSLQNASLVSNGGFSGTLTGTGTIKKDSNFSIKMTGKAEGVFSFNINEGIYSGGGGGPLETAVKVTAEGSIGAITFQNVLDELATSSLSDPTKFTTGNLVETKPMSINLQKGNQGGSNSLALLEALSVGSVTVFAEDTNNQCLLAKTFQVTKDFFGSIPPDIIQAYLSPVSVPPDGKTNVRVSAQVYDEEGADTITTVTADLGKVGLGFVPLTSESCAPKEGQKLKTCFYQSAEFTVPVTTPEGSYSFNVLATDSTGNTTTRALSLIVTDNITGPVVTNLTLSSRSSIPNDGTTEFSLFATVSDPDGLSDVTSVVAYPSIDSEPIVLKLGEGASGTGKSGLYSATGLTIPTTAFTGTHTYNVQATDASGLVGSATIDFSVTNKDTLGEPPRVLEEKAYTTPQALVNDGETPGTLFVPIEDRDGDITQVIVNLASVGGKQGTQTQSNVTQGAASSTSTTSSTVSTASADCTTASPQVPCMELAFREGDIYWYILKDFTIPSTTSGRLAPYYVDVIVTDKLNKTDTGVVPIVVSDGVSGGGFEAQLKAKAAIPTSATTVEVVFNQELDPNTLNKNLFEILDMNNANNKLPLTQVSINASNRIVTLTTAEQLPHHPYVVNFKEGLMDTLGQALVPGGENRLAFKGFAYLGKIPAVQFAEALEGSRIHLEFDGPLKASTLPLGGPDYSQIKIYEEGNLKPLHVVGVNMLTDKTVELLTEAQKPGQRYVVEMTGVRSYDGILVDLVKNVVKGVGTVSAELKKVAGTADLDGDGDVDFSDFTLFSTVYGTTY